MSWRRLRGILDESWGKCRKKVEGDHLLEGFLRAKMEAKIIKIHLFLMIFLDFRHLQDEIYFRCHFGTNLAPFSLPGSSKILLKTDPNRGPIVDRFLLLICIDFSSVLGAKLEPCEPTVSSQTAQEACTTPQNASKTPQNTSQDAPCSQNPSRSPPGFDCDRFFIDFWWIFRRFMIDL